MEACRAEGLWDVGQHWAPGNEYAQLGGGEEQAVRLASEWDTVSAQVHSQCAGTRCQCNFRCSGLEGPLALNRLK